MNTQEANNTIDSTVIADITHKIDLLQAKITANEDELKKTRESFLINVTNLESEIKKLKEIHWEYTKALGLLKNDLAYGH